MRSFWSRTIAAIAAVAALAGGICVPASASPAVRLLGAKTAYDRAAGWRTVGHLAADAPFGGAATVVPVYARARVGGRVFLRVALGPRRSGWITNTNVIPLQTRYSVVVNTRARALTVYRSGRVVRHVAVVVGKPSTPTPHGRFYVVARVAQSPGSDLGRWALITSAIGHASELGIGLHVALHGSEALGAPVGSAASHGCVRMHAADLAYLASHLTPGSRVLIH